MRQLTPTDTPDDIPDWVYSQWFEEWNEERDQAAAVNIDQAFLLRDRHATRPDDDGEEGWQLLDQVQALLNLSTDLGVVSRAILRPLVQALDPANRMAKAAQRTATKLEADRLGVDLEPSDY